MSMFVFLLAATASAAPTVLHPSGPWAAEYAQDMCVLSRSFGTGENRLLFAFKPAPNSDSARLMLLRSAKGSRVTPGKANIQLSDGSRPPWANFWSASTKGNNLMAIDLPRSSLQPLFRGGSITIQAGRQLNVSIVPTGMAKAIEALGRCESDLLKKWGMDETAQAALAKHPERLGGSVFRSEDYPDDLLKRGIQGWVGVVLSVDERGQATDCRAVETSGTPTLDETTCTIMRKRAKFRPALDRQGKPMAALTYWRVNWLIEDSFSYELNPGPGARPASTALPPVN